MALVHPLAHAAGLLNILRIRMRHGIGQGVRLTNQGVYTSVRFSFTFGRVYEGKSDLSVCSASAARLTVGRVGWVGGAVPCAAANA